MKAAELGDSVKNDELNDERRQASVELYHLLLNLCDGAAFSKVVNAGDGEGGLAWKSIVERWDPKLKTRQAGILLSVLKWSFAGDILGRIEDFERVCQQYTTQSRRGGGVHRVVSCGLDDRPRAARSRCACVAASVADAAVVAQAATRGPTHSSLPSILRANQWEYTDSGT